jgi:hypothetical protein
VFGEDENRKDLVKDIVHVCGRVSHFIHIIWCHGSNEIAMDSARRSNLEDKNYIPEGHNILQFSSLIDHKENNIKITAQDKINERSNKQRNQ